MTLSRVGVLGGGRMGAGIAHAFLMTGASVTVVDIDPAGPLERITRDVEKSIERGAAGAASDYLDRLTCTSSVTDFVGCELVVEAIPENFDLKVSAFADIAAAAPDAVIASNTSSLSITDLAATVPHPDRVIGLHFFNPVPASKLVEIVVAQTTSAELVEEAKGWVSDLGKTPIVVKDAPGFASSRLGVAIALEAIRMVEEGVASPSDIMRRWCWATSSRLGRWHSPISSAWTSASASPSTWHPHWANVSNLPR